MPNTSLVRQAFLTVADGIVRAESGWPDKLVLDLERAVGAETVGYAGDLEKGFGGYSANIGGPPLTEDERSMWRSHHDEFPFLSLLLSGGEGVAERSSERLSRSEFRRTVVYAEHFRPRRSHYQANFGTVHDGRIAMVGLYRSARDFSADEIDALECGRQLLVRALQYRTIADELEALVESVPPAPTPAAQPTLTPRQQEVLVLLATGATDRRIARQLQITESTVRKHLSDIRDRLHVVGRVGAATWWLTEGRRQRDIAQSPTTDPERPRERDR